MVLQGRMSPSGLTTIYRLPQPQYTLIQVVSEKFFIAAVIQSSLASSVATGESSAVATASGCCKVLLGNQLASLAVAR